MEIEVDRYRNEFNRLRYDYSFLKSEYEHEVVFFFVSQYFHFFCTTLFSTNGLKIQY